MESGRILDTRAERPWLHTLFVVLGPLGLAAAITLSLWVSGLSVERSVVVQVEPQWVAGERLAVRAQLLDADLKGVEGTTVSVWATQGGARHELGELAVIDQGGLAQGEVDLPTALEQGEATVHLRFRDPAGEALVESFAVGVVDARDVREGRHTYTTSVLMWADDTDPQPEGVRIDLRAFGRFLAGFDNLLFVRITDPLGRPVDVQLRVVLVSGEFRGLTGSAEAPPVLFEGRPDRLGLVDLRGRLTSDVVRVRVDVEGGAPMSTASRQFRLVSFPGSVQTRSNPVMVEPGDAVELSPLALRTGRPVFMDLHGPDGGWLSALPPAYPGKGAPTWTVPRDAPVGFYQVEAYRYTNAPGEGTAVARFYVSDLHPTDPDSLRPLFDKHREQLDLPRTDKEFDEQLERGYLRFLEGAQPSGEALERAREWLAGGLQLEVLGPPLALSTRAREDEALATFKASWTLRLRWFLLGGGSLFILFMGLSLWRAYAKVARDTVAALREGVGEGEDVEEEDFDDGVLVAETHRAMLARGAVVVGIMFAALLLTVMMLESLVWVF